MVTEVLFYFISILLFFHPESAKTRMVKTETFKQTCSFLFDHPIQRRILSEKYIFFHNFSSFWL